MDFYGFYTGQVFDAYEYLGAHRENDKIVFRTFAPAAKNISLICSYNNWEEIPMHKVYDGNFWQVEIPYVDQMLMYKYRIYSNDGRIIDHIDPYEFYSELRPNNASIYYDLNNYQFKDNSWNKKQNNMKDKPLNIYEVHAGSWKQKEDGSWYTYREMADLLIPYVKDHNYNFVEFLPLSEHPSDESWGYQNTGFFAPTSRYGTPDDLRYLIDCLHQNDIGAIIDFVPVHFAIDDFGLAKYDGTSLYEYPHSDVGVSEWGSCNFMHSRGEVRSFLQSNAYYWLKEFHFDGLRMDAISNLIYWNGDVNRGVNNTTISFIQTMNKGLKERVPNCLLIAEDSSSYKGVTSSVEENGLGFDYKWDLGWMNDTLDYFQTDYSKRTDKYHKLTFSMMYYYNEDFILPFSHDEVVHGKKTIIDKMYGEYEEKFEQARALYMYMYAHPGKKLNFMGNELGQFREWDEKREQDWLLMLYPKHVDFNHFIRHLNYVYTENPAFYQMDYEQEGFQWIDCHQEEKCLYLFERKSKEQRILCIFNFSNKEQTYELSLKDVKNLHLLLSSKEYRDVQNNKTIVIPKYSAAYYIIND